MSQSNFSKGLGKKLTPAILMIFGACALGVAGCSHNRNCANGQCGSGASFSMPSFFGGSTQPSNAASQQLAPTASGYQPSEYRAGSSGSELGGSSSRTYQGSGSR